MSTKQDSGILSTEITRMAAQFVEGVQYSDIPGDAIRLGTRCLLDGLGLIVAGTDEESVTILSQEAYDIGGKPEALLLGYGNEKVPADKAGRVLGTAIHAHDWDDSQVSKDPEHVYGLLTHPTANPLCAALVVSQRLPGISGQDFMLGFLTGFEVECKISEWMRPEHYKRGMHSTGTVGTFGSFATTAKLLGLNGNKLRCGFGIAASLAAGIRVNFGTMSKPLHVGRAVENGILAAHLASRGFTADLNALDGPWGFFQVHGGGLDPEKLCQGFGKVWSIVAPGVSIKPYPCGVLTHPSMDLMLKLVVENDLKPEAIKSIELYAGSNILNPIRYPIAHNHLQAKFSLPAELAMMVLNRKAGKKEFSDDFVGSNPMQEMQQKIKTIHDPEIENLGFDKMRSRIEINLIDGSKIIGTADEKYRGGPENPLTEEELEEKVKACCEGILDSRGQQQLIGTARSVTDLDNAMVLAGVIQSEVNIKP